MIMYNDFVARLTLKLLGASHIALDEQPITYFRSINVQGILIYLALHPTQPLSRDVLATLFWPVETESRARANLRQSLYQLRLLLGDMNSPERPFLLVTRHTAQLNPECDYTVDVQQFLGAIENHDLATAVSIYQGELVPGFACDSAQFEDWLRQERQNLHYLAMAAMHELAQDHLQAGHLDEAQSVARRQLGFEPWCEPAHRQLMRAHALAGDRANALAQYEACRKALDEELGVAPAPETVALFEDIKKSRIGPLTTGQAIQPPRRIKHNLPAETVPLIGRELELAQIRNLFTRYGQRLVTIVGPGGMGKTRLALATGYALLEQNLDGVYFVDLAPLEQAGDIPIAISGALDFQLPDKSRDLFPQLLNWLCRRQILLILDNFEHLLDGVALIDGIMQACPDVAILVTSRQRLNMAIESRFELGGLDYPDSLTPEDAHDFTAVQLFLDNGRRIQPDFVLNENNIAGVIRICQAVQGMPLGLLLAAAWLELLSPAEIAAEIEARLGFLAADLADIPPRQRSMQAVFERSWDMLAPDEQAVLAGLSIFRGGFARQAAEQVTGANLRILLSLVSKSLVQRQTRKGRFTLHELLRQFAASKRDRTGEIEFAHCIYFTRVVGEEFRRGLGFWPLHLPRRLAVERDNIRRAWDYAIVHTLANELPVLTKGLVTFSFTQGVHPEIMINQAIRTLRGIGMADTHPVLYQLHLMTRNFLYDDRLSKRLFLRLLSQIGNQGEPSLLYWTYERLAACDRDLGNPEALEWAKKAVEIALMTGDEILIRRAQADVLWTRVAFGLQDESTILKLQKILDFLETVFAESVAVYKTLLSISACCLSIADYESAIYYGARSLNIAKSWQDTKWISMANKTMANIYLKMDRPDRAAGQMLDDLAWHQAIAQEWQTVGNLEWIAIYCTNLLGGVETAVPILSMVYHHPEALTYYREDIEHARPRFEEEMGSEAFAAAWDRGKELDLDTAVARVRSALESVGK